VARVHRHVARSIVTAALPEPAELLAWYRCTRKQQLPTEAVAVLACRALWDDLSHYPCGDHWHLGRTPSTAGRWTLKHARRAWLSAGQSR
jgi:hypothetical protein